MKKGILDSRLPNDLTYSFLVAVIRKDPGLPPLEFRQHLPGMSFF